VSASSATYVIRYHEPEVLSALVAEHGFRVADVRSRPPLEHEHAVTELFVTAVAG
jgi:hypothetical protein